MSPETSAAIVCGPLRILMTSTLTPCLRKKPCSTPVQSASPFSLKAPWVTRTSGSSAPSETTPSEATNKKTNIENQCSPFASHRAKKNDLRFKKTPEQFKYSIVNLI